MVKKINRIAQSLCLLLVLFSGFLVTASAEDALSVTVSWEITEASVSIAEGVYRWDTETLQYVWVPLDKPHLSSTTPAEVVIRLESSGKSNVNYTISYTGSEGIDTQVESDSPDSGTLTGENKAADYESKIHITGITPSFAQEVERFKIGTYTVILNAADTPTPIIEELLSEEQPIEEQPPVEDAPEEQPSEEEPPEEQPPEEQPPEEQPPEEQPPEEEPPEEQPIEEEPAEEQPSEEIPNADQSA